MSSIVLLRLNSNLIQKSFHQALTRKYGIKVTKPFKPPITAKPKIDLTDKVAIVTGGAEGIGLSIARTFLEMDIAAVTICDNSKDRGKEPMKQLLEDYGEKIMYVDCDVSKSQAFDKVFKETQKRFETVNIVINNAGVMNDVNWEGQITNNLASTAIGTLLGMQYMSKTCFGYGGTIVNINSIMGLIPSAGYPIHTMTQFGIVGFSRAIGNTAHYERTGVKVMALCPGLTNTKLIKQAPYHAINEKFRKEFKDESGGCTLQKPEAVACGVMDIMESGQPGSVWVVENNSSPYEVRFPEVADLRFKNKI